MFSPLNKGQWPLIEKVSHVYIKKALSNLCDRVLGLTESCSAEWVNIRHPQNLSGQGNKTCSLLPFLLPLELWWSVMTVATLWGKLWSYSLKVLGNNSKIISLRDPVWSLVWVQNWEKRIKVRFPGQTCAWGEI